MSQLNERLVVLATLPIQIDQLGSSSSLGQFTKAKFKLKEGFIKKLMVLRFT